ncbi:hypothetical protein E2C01_019336 [Portunus trituberculatus]|uniref:Uncharacterized protein n=1 Tax=Portunus trituberculatus TaxID=210409 RepID=A0A5B7DWX7_PORTR|nr:hypothetical protein [Portunus trituberculatus]
MGSQAPPQPCLPLRPSGSHHDLDQDAATNSPSIPVSTPHISFNSQCFIGISCCLPPKMYKV